MLALLLAHQSRHDRFQALGQDRVDHLGAVTQRQDIGGNCGATCSASLIGTTKGVADCASAGMARNTQAAKTVARRHFSMELAAMACFTKFPA